jgi:hypothetical protein
MVIRIISKWADGSQHESKITTDASRARYLMAARRAADSAHRSLREVKNGYQYDTPRQYTGNAGGCTTTVTLERGWA